MKRVPSGLPSAPRGAASKGQPDKSKPNAELSGEEVFLGNELLENEEDKPLSKGTRVTVSRSLLQQGHMHIRGRTRSGKTSLAIAPLAEQLMSPYERLYTDSNGDTQRFTDRDAIFVFDLGGDTSLFNRIKQAAKDFGRNFRYLSLDSDCSYYFDPFQSIPPQKDRIVQVCTLLMKAFNMDYGLIYGGSYYTQKNLSALLRVAEEAVLSKQAGHDIGLQQISDELQRSKDRDEAQVRMTFQFLLQYPQLTPSVNEKNIIDMKQAISDREVIYFFCPTIAEAITARQIAGLGLYTAINAARQLTQERDVGDRVKPLPHSHVFVDEFQEVAGTSFSSVLAQASKFGISLYLANQTTNQLENRDLNLADIVRDNTLTKLYFTVTGKKDIEELQTFSQDILRKRRGESQVGALESQGVTGSVRTSYHEVPEPMLEKRTILETSASEGNFFTIINDGAGHREPIRTVRKQSLPLEDYIKYRSTPLPTVDHDRNSEEQQSSTSDKPVWEQLRSKSPEGVRIERMKKLDALLNDKIHAETSISEL